MSQRVEANKLEPRNRDRDFSVRADVGKIEARRERREC